MANRANLANSVLATGISNSDTSMTVYAGDGAIFPDAPFYLTLTPKNSISQISNSEIVLVTAVTDDTFTITRARRDTSAKSFPAGTVVSNGIYTQDIIDIVYPVGSIYTELTGVNPGTTFGVGTWTQFGAGKVLVGQDDGDGDFDTAEATGGEKEHTLTVDEMPSHTHIQNSHNHTQNSHNHSQNSHNHVNYNNLTRFSGGTSEVGLAGGGTKYLSAASNSAVTATNNATTATNNATTATNQNTGGDGAHNNLQPYIVVYFWKRTV